MRTPTLCAATRFTPRDDTRGLNRLDAAALAFPMGFYASLAKDEPPAVAFDAGRAQMSLSGFCEGDPDDYKPCPGCWARTQARDSAGIDGTAVENSPIC